VHVHVGAKVAEVLPQGVKLADAPRSGRARRVGGRRQGPTCSKRSAGSRPTGSISWSWRDSLQVVGRRRHLSRSATRRLSVPGHDANVPPRAQAAHQQASHVLRQIKRRFAGPSRHAVPLPRFRLLVSLGEYSTVGNLMGGLIGAACWSKLVRAHDCICHCTKCTNTRCTASQGRARHPGAQ